MYTRAELAERWKVSRQTIRRYEELGLLTPVRLGPRMVRYRAAEVARLMTPANAESPASTPGSLANTAVAGGSDESYNPAA